MSIAVLMQSQVARLHPYGFGNACAGVVEKHQKRMFGSTLGFAGIDDLNDGFHFFSRQPLERFLRAGLFGGDGADRGRPFATGRFAGADKTGECPNGGKTYIASLHRTAAFGLDMIEKRTQMSDAQVRD